MKRFVLLTSLYLPIILPLPSRGEPPQSDRPLVEHQQETPPENTKGRAKSMPSKVLSQSLEETKTEQSTKHTRQGDYAGYSAKNNEVLLEVLAVALPNDKSYLPKNNAWGQYLIKVRNLGTALLQIKDVKFIDGKGAFVDSAISASDLLKQPDYAGQYATEMGVVLAPSAVALVAPALALTPLIFLAPIVSLFMGHKSMQDLDHTGQLTKTFAERTLKRALLDREGEATGLVFLPLIKEPRSLVLEYEYDGKPRRMRLPLSSSSSKEGPVQ